jgi:hypothetical protein
VLLPDIGDLLELVWVEMAAIKLTRDEAVERVGEVELELAVQEALLSGVERDGEARYVGVSCVGLCSTVVVILGLPCLC